MRNLAVRTATLASALVMLACTESPKEPATVALVENGLLPPTLIEGEPGFALEERMDHHGVPGVSVAVIRGAEIEWVRHYGVMNRDDHRPVTESTLFNIGSLSKAVTATAILSLAEDGLVDLDAPVNDQLRSWKIPENEFTRQAHVTPLRLMNHSGGVVFSPPFNYPAESLPTLDQILAGAPPARNAAVTVDRVPGTGFQYSNAGFEILRKLAEDVSGQPFGEVVEQRVFKTAGMPHSAIDVPLPPPELSDAAMGHRGDGAPDAAYRRWLPHIAAGGVWTTAADYAALVVELQRALRDDSGAVLSKESVELMVQPHEAAQYGLGVFQRGGGEQARYVGHLGDGPGFVAGFVMDIVGGRGTVILANGQGGISLVREIAAAVATAEQWPDYLPDVHAPVRLEQELLGNLAGRYRTGFDRELEIRREGESLWLESFDLPAMKLYAVEGRKLVCRERRGEIAYGLDSGNTVEWVSYHLSDALGRISGDPLPMQRLATGERTPMGLLLDGNTDEAMARYRMKKSEDPEAPSVAEGRLNSLGYRLLGKGDLEGALAVFRLNVELYPGSANTYDSLGEALVEIGQTEEARKNYAKSLELDLENTNARNKLNELSGRP